MQVTHFLEADGSEWVRAVGEHLHAHVLHAFFSAPQPLLATRMAPSAVVTQLLCDTPLDIVDGVLAALPPAARALPLASLLHALPPPLHAAAVRAAGPP